MKPGQRKPVVTAARLFSLTATVAPSADLLPSWNGDSDKQSIINFVDNVTSEYRGVHLGMTVEEVRSRLGEYSNRQTKCLEVCND
jgi:hypothetical protein